MTPLDMNKAQQVVELMQAQTLDDKASSDFHQGQHRTDGMHIATHVWPCKGLEICSAANKFITA